MMSRQLINLGLAFSLTLGLSACVSLLPDPQPAAGVYRFTSSAAPVAKRANAEVIRVDRPAATQVYSSNDIVVTNDGQKLSVVAMANWSEATPLMLQSAMIDALGASPNFVGIIPTSGARTDTRLHLSVQNFEASFDNGPESAPLAIVSYRVTYARADDRNLLGTHTVRQSLRAQSINVSSIVSALESANSAAMMDIVNWLEGKSKTGAS